MIKEKVSEKEVLPKVNKEEVHPEVSEKEVLKRIKFKLNELSKSRSRIVRKKTVGFFLDKIAFETYSNLPVFSNNKEILAKLTKNLKNGKVIITFPKNL